MNKNNILNIVLTALVSLIFVASGFFKLMPPADKAAEMAKGVGGATNLTLLGILEISMVVLFIMKRTGVLGSLLLIAYMGGAIAVHLTTGQPLLVPILIQAFVWIVSAYRFPELKQRLFNA